MHLRKKIYIAILSVLASSPAPVSYTHLDVYKRQSHLWLKGHLIRRF